MDIYRETPLNRRADRKADKTDRQKKIDRQTDTNYQIVGHRQTQTKRYRPTIADRNTKDTNTDRLIVRLKCANGRTDR